MSGDFRELQVWQKAHQLALCIYKVTATFPGRETYGLVSQMRRSCISIPANLAEGSGRLGDAELARFCSIALGSANELDYHLLLANDLRLLTQADYCSLSERTDEVRRMLIALRQYLKKDKCHSKESGLKT